MELLCIETHPEKVVMAGQIYVARKFTVKPCFCREELVDVGLKAEPTNKMLWRCPKCGFVYRNDLTWWLRQNRFVPIGNIDELENYKQSEPALK